MKLRPTPDQLGSLWILSRARLNSVFCHRGEMNAAAFSCHNFPLISQALVRPEARVTELKVHQPPPISFQQVPGELECGWTEEKTKKTGQANMELTSYRQRLPWLFCFVTVMVFKPRGMLLKSLSERDKSSSWLWVSQNSVKNVQVCCITILKMSFFFLKCDFLCCLYFFA